MKAPKVPGYIHIGTSVRRFVAKTEISNSKDDVIIFLKNLLGEEHFNQLSEIDIIKYLNEIEQASNMRNQVLEAINPWCQKLLDENTRNSRKKADELISIGRFFHSLNIIKNVKILEKAEPPDFIIEYKGYRIGVEITGIYDSQVVAKINSAKEILKKCQIKLSKESKLKGNFYLNIYPSKLKFSKSEEERIIAQICDYLITIEQGDTSTPPAYIQYLFKDESENLDLSLYEDYWLTELTPETVGKIIMRKEKSINKYQLKHSLQKCWLLLIIGGASSISSFDYSLISNFNANTKFDNVFIYDQFKGKLIYSKHPL